mmetsp:Transcript_26873/g.41157  ORF Transcript_26873/g.41157 Transcript_26873/m.41157 type:complete len:631 (-) Transcript_26873:108-2000(-)|eukprot:CAMPEP_0195307632 /NCGR_PEP_ID=MMETSP0707-20130614/37814_1 /TAXON_ID=33640 /ORGANISM="Asterionellopsis glacialis, Strain CCMP134" /LENGTH=630 /DNA_ID=CAMNT_0040371885 /DNA_START=38 /DNA_END=1930 /DNA_ORIENTATION=+
MGNRVKGKVKKKSVKAASHSGMGSKRKLSRMGKKRKKDHSGLDATFIGRSNCLKRLQISLKDFRRLCILKGVYPREPRGRAPGNKKGQVYYHIKDVRAIAHEPVLHKFREFRAFMKKVRKAAGRNEKDEAARRHALAPSYTIHHLVRERYPRFQDALSDMDDALTLVHLFAALPSEGRIKTKITNKAKALAAAWGAYCTTTSSVTKSFISVKGVYMEASILGSTIRWVNPHSFTQHLPTDVDYRVMLTFFEFYETLLSFVLFKLYSDIGVRYPLSMAEAGGQAKGSASAVLASNLHALTNALKSSDGAVSNVVSEAVESTTKGSSEPKDKESKKKSRELIKSVGAALNKISNDDSDEEDFSDDEDVDVGAPLKAALDSMAEAEERSAIPGSVALDDDATKRRRLFAGLTFFLSREVPRGYLELVCLSYGGKVGWEGADSPITASDPTITHHIVDRPKLPSSFEKFPKSREYIQPQWVMDCANFLFVLPITKYGVGAELPPHLSPWVDDEEEGYKPAYGEEIERLKNGETMEAEDMDEDSEEDMDENGGAENGEKDLEDEEDEAVTERRAKKKKQKEDEEAHKLAKTMMSKKASRLYGRMQHGLSEKQAKVDALHKRREELDSKKKKKRKN